MTYYSLIILVIFAFGPKLLVYTHTLIHIPYNPAFLHMTVLCCLQFPPSLRQIYIYCIFLGVREERKRERGKAYCTIIGVFAQIGKGIGGILYLVQNLQPTTTTVQTPYEILRQLPCYSTILYFTHGVHGIVHPLYCIHTHTLITVFTI